MKYTHQRNWSGTLLHGILAFRQVAYITMTSIQLKDILSIAVIDWTSLAYCSVAVLLQLAILGFLVLAMIKPEVYHHSDGLPYKVIAVLGCFVTLDLFRLGSTIGHISYYKDERVDVWIAVALHSMEVFLDSSILGAVATKKDSKLGDGLKRVALPFNSTRDV